MKPLRILFLICAAAFALRLALLPIIQHPGIGDSNHYYNLGIRLVEGHGYTIDYLWQYNDPPDALVHPDDYWMPLNSAIVAGAMTLLGTSVHAAVLPFMLLGALLPLLVYAAVRQFGVGIRAALLAAACGAVLPEYVLNSLRTDTTLPALWLTVGSVLLLTRGLQRGGWWSFAGSGLLGGLAYLVRSDAALLLPMLVVTLLVYALWGRQQVTTRTGWKYAILMPLVALLVVTPWLLRNIAVAGVPTTPRLSDMFFLTDFREHYVYSSPVNFATMTAQWSWGQIIGKRIFEMFASAKIMYTTLDAVLPLAVAGGALLLLAARDRKRLLTLAPAVLLLLGAYGFYTVLVPFKSEGGSFKKFYLMLIPLLLPLAAYALERALPNPRHQLAAGLLTVALLGANGVELVRADARAVDAYLGFVEQVVTVAQTLPDTNGDGEIVLMTQDPFMLRFFGVRSVMTPYENRDVVLEVAQRYGVDYLLMPADRPSLDPVYVRTISDPRYAYVTGVSGTNAEFYAFDFAAPAAGGQ